MKKLSLLLVLIITLFIPFYVNAEDLNVKTLEASYSDNAVTVKGTVDDGVLAVAIMIYDSDESNVLKFETTNVNEDNTFEHKVVFEKEGTYVIKAANYDGGDYKSVNLSISSNEKKETPNNPKTIDNILIYLVVTILAVVGIFGTKIYFKKKIK